MAGDREDAGGALGRHGPGGGGGGPALGLAVRRRREAPRGTGGGLSPAGRGGAECPARDGHWPARRIWDFRVSKRGSGIWNEGSIYRHRGS